MSAPEQFEPLVDEGVLEWARRGVWLVCVAVYVTVFVGNISGGASDLTAVGKAIGFTVAAAILGRLAVGVLARATQPVQEQPMADEDGPVGSLIDLVSSTNVSNPQDEAQAA